MAIVGVPKSEPGGSIRGTKTKTGTCQTGVVSSILLGNFCVGLGQRETEFWKPTEGQTKSYFRI